jgi:hypothetical protein
MTGVEATRRKQRVSDRFPSNGSKDEGGGYGSEVQLFGYAFSRSSVRPLRRGREASRTGATMVVHHNGRGGEEWVCGRLEEMLTCC